MMDQLYILSLDSSKTTVPGRTQPASQNYFANDSHCYFIATNSRYTATAADVDVDNLVIAKQESLPRTTKCIRYLEEARQIYFSLHNYLISSL